MSLISDCLPLINAAWSLVEDYGVAHWTVVVRRRVWSSGKIRTGTYTDTDLTIDPKPLVQEVEGGRRLRVGPITPSHAGGGYTVAQLSPTPATGTEMIYVVTGPGGTRNYQLVELNTTEPFEYMIELASLDRVYPQ